MKLYTDEVLSLFADNSIELINNGDIINYFKFLEEINCYFNSIANF